MNSKITLLLLILSLVNALAAAEIKLTSGEKLEDLVKFEKETFQVGDKNIPFSQVMELIYSDISPRRLGRQHQIILQDGSCVVAEVTTGDDKIIKLDFSQGEEPFEVPLDKVRSVSFTELEPGVVISKLPEEDFILAQNGKVTSAVPAFITFLHVGFMQGSIELKLRKDSIANFVFKKKSTSFPGANIRVRTRYGDVVYGKLKSLNGAVEVSTIIGDLKYKAGDLLKIEILNGSTVDLSDVKPKSINTVSYLGDMLSPVFNKSFSGGSIDIGGSRIEKGICMQSKTSIVYTISGSYKALECGITLDKKFSVFGDVDFVIKGDGKELIRKNVTSVDNIQSIRVSLVGVQELVLELDFAKNGNSGDFGIWTSPRLIK